MNTRECAQISSKAYVTVFIQPSLVITEREDFTSAHTVIVQFSQFLQSGEEMKAGIYKQFLHILFLACAFPMWKVDILYRAAQGVIFSNKKNVLIEAKNIQNTKVCPYCHGGNTLFNLGERGNRALRPFGNLF